MEYTVYILYSQSLNIFYKGHTDDLGRRLFQHNSGYDKFTKKGTPWILIWATPKLDKSGAAILEIKLKNLSRKRLKDFIIRHSEGINEAGSWVLTMPT